MRWPLRWFGFLSIPKLTLAGIFDGISAAFNSMKDAVSDKDVEVKVDSHTWTRTQTIETLNHQRLENWCSQKPEDAYDLTVERKKRGTRKSEQRIANGQEYTYNDFVDYYAPEKRVADDGVSYTYKDFIEFYGKDGQADKKWINATKVDQASALQVATDNWQKASKRDCTGECCPNCFDEVEWDFWCQYSVDRWEVKVSEKSNGNNAYPYWPDVQIEECSVPSIGCERKGNRVQSFSVELTLIENGVHSKTQCANALNIEFADWQLLVVGEVYPAKRRLAYGLLCGSIQFPHKGRKRRIAKDKKPYTYDEFLDFYGKAGVDRWQAAPWEGHDEF